jgi:hypothetical protein
MSVFAQAQSALGKDTFGPFQSLTPSEKKYPIRAM